MQEPAMPVLPPLALPSAIRQRIVEGVNGLSMHVLEAGFETRQRPLLLLLHGFPELAFSWRKLMPALAAAGYHVLAPDQRGYGRSTGADVSYEGDVRSFSLLNLARDALALVNAFGYREVHAVVGHDFGSNVAAWCALTRPDVFRRAVMMSAPFAGVAPLPFGTADAPQPRREDTIHRDLAALARPRKHYQWYYSTRGADPDMHAPPQGLQAFLRAYYHVKSADWPGNNPHPLQSWSAHELAKLPDYYVMPLEATMPEAVAPFMPTHEQIAACDWLPDHELRIYAAEYARTGFQGGLNWYRCGTEAAISAELQLFSGRTIDVPAAFIAGAQDWGIHQKPGALQAMQSRACSDMRAVHLIEGAGHWVQQERPREVIAALLGFLSSTA
jgi:pimeloyl-ACP methyl ester carboxylesterase